MIWASKFYRSECGMFCAGLQAVAHPFTHSLTVQRVLTRRTMAQASCIKGGGVLCPQHKTRPKESLANRPIWDPPRHPPPAPPTELLTNEACPGPNPDRACAPKRKPADRAVARLLRDPWRQTLQSGPAVDGASACRHTVHARRQPGVQCRRAGGRWLSTRRGTPAARQRPDGMDMATREEGG